MIVRLLAVPLFQAINEASAIMDGAGGAIACIDLCLELLTFSRT